MSHKMKLLADLTAKRNDGIKLNRADRRLVAKLERGGLKMPPAPEKTDPAATSTDGQ